jgi:hypothetical protein
MLSIRSCHDDAVLYRYFCIAFIQSFFLLYYKEICINIRKLHQNDTIELRSLLTLWIARMHVHILKIL